MIQPHLDIDGYCLLNRVLSTDDCNRLAAEIAVIFDSNKNTGETIQSGKGPVIGGRNLIDQWDGWRTLIKLTSVKDFVASSCGTNAGLVRILFFDKPPGNGWALAMHRDKTIAVTAHQIPPAPFDKPTKKAGVPHVEASKHLLSKMVTLRFHLDAMHCDNGPLTVIPTSHLTEESTNDPIEIHCQQGDVFAMRPLLVHGSLAAKSNTQDHRRVIHLEFAPNARLPAGYQWHRYETLG